MNRTWVKWHMFFTDGHFSPKFLDAFGKWKIHVLPYVSSCLNLMISAVAAVQFEAVIILGQKPSSPFGLIKLVFEVSTRAVGVGGGGAGGAHAMPCDN